MIIEEHVAYYRPTNIKKYKAIINSKNFDADMVRCGCYYRSIHELADGEFMGVFTVEVGNHSSFLYFKERGVSFVMTRTTQIKTPKIIAEIALKEIEKKGIDAETILEA